MDGGTAVTDGCDQKPLVDSEPAPRPAGAKGREARPIRLKPPMVDSTTATVNHRGGRGERGGG